MNGIHPDEHAPPTNFPTVTGKLGVPSQTGADQVAEHARLAAIGRRVKAEQARQTREEMPRNAALANVGQQGERLLAAIEVHAERKMRWVKVIEEWENEPSDDLDLALMCMAEADVEQAELRDEERAAALAAIRAHTAAQAVVETERDQARAEVERLRHALDDSDAEVDRLVGVDRWNARLTTERGDALATIERVRALVAEAIADDGQERLGTHWDGCHKVHHDCLGVAIRAALDPPKATT